MNRSLLKILVASVPIKTSVSAILSSMVLICISRISLYLGPVCMPMFISGLSQETMDLQMSLLLAIVMGCSVPFSHILSELSMASVSRALEQVGYDVSRDVLRAILSKNLMYFQELNIGDFSNRFQNGLKAVRSILFSVVYIFIPIAIECLVALCIIGYHLGKEFLLIIGIGLGMYFFAVQFAWGIQTRLNNELQRLEIEANKRLLDSFMCIDSVLIDGRADDQLDYFLEAERNTCDRSINYYWSMVYLTFLKQGVVGITALVAISYFVFQVKAGNLVPASIVSLVAMLGYMFSPLTNLASKLKDFSKAVVNARNMFELLVEQTQFIPTFVKPQPSLAASWPEKPGSLVLQSVLVLLSHKALNFQLEWGKLVVLSGKSGIGKSSLCKCLAGLNALQSGEIFIDNVPLSKIAPEVVRQNIGYLGQDGLLFNRSILENIIYSCPDVPIEKVYEACRIADIHSFVEGLQEGYQTMVMERGANLSAGQRQRLFIARMLIKSPKMIILDESTSNLDEVTEEKVLRGIFSNFKESLIIWVSHRIPQWVETDFQPTTIKLN